MVDVALGILGASVRVGVAVVRATAESSVVRSVAAWRPPLVPARLQPASIVADIAKRGARDRAWVTESVVRLLDQWTPVIAELVVSRLDLTDIVTRHVNIDEIVEAVDLDAVAARDRPRCDRAAHRPRCRRRRRGPERGRRGRGHRRDRRRLDIDAVIERIDLIAMVEEVIAAIDLPAIIRDSTGSMASETVRSARMTGISADDAISRGLERHLFRRRRAPLASDAP